MRTILCIAAAAVLVLIGCGEEKKIVPLSENQQKVLSFFPEDAGYAMFMNLSELRKTEFWDNYFKASLQNNDSNNWLSRLEKETGIGLQSGIAEFYTASAWNGNNVIAFLFDKKTKKVRQFFRSPNNFDIGRIEDTEVYQLKNTGRSYFYFPNDSILIFTTSRDYITKLVNRENSSLKNNSELFGIIRSIRNKDHYWMATNEGSYAAALLEKLIPSNPDIPVKRIVQTVHEITLAAAFDENVEIESTWGCKSTKDAYLLSTAIKGALAMDLLSEENYTLGQLLKDLQVNRTNDRINLNLKLGKENISKLKKLANKENLEKKL